MTCDLSGSSGALAQTELPHALQTLVSNFVKLVNLIWIAYTCVVFYINATTLREAYAEVCAFLRNPKIHSQKPSDADAGGGKEHEPLSRQKDSNHSATSSVHEPGVQLVEELCLDPHPRLVALRKRFTA